MGRYIAQSKKHSRVRLPLTIGLALIDSNVYDLLIRRLISAFSDYLPDMKATFSIFDQPQIYLSWARRGSLVDLGLSGKGESLKPRTNRK